MYTTLQTRSGLRKVRQPSLLWKFPVVDLPSWPALLGLLVIFSIIGVLTVTIICHDAMYSPLNRSPRRQYLALHNQYLESATSYFGGFNVRDQDFNSSKESNQSRSTRFDIGGDVSSISTAVVVMASKRRVPYVQIWAWSLLTGSSSSELNQTLVTIVNTERPSSANSEDLEPLRYVGIPVVDMYENDASEAGNRKQWSSWILDQYLCYIEALRSCDRAEVLWCIVFEEDSLLTRNLLGTFRALVRDGLESRANVGMVKLFTTDAWSGYQWPSWLHDLLLIPGCLAGVLTAPLACFIIRINDTMCQKRRRYVPTSSTSPPKGRGSFFKLALVFMTLFANIVIVAQVMSRQSVIAMLDFPGIHLDPCTSAASAVAVAFPIEISRKLREHLERIFQSRGRARPVPIDVEMFAWAESLGLAVLKTSPSLAQHIGLFSSNPMKGRAKYLNQDSRFKFLARENSLIRALPRLVSSW